MSLVWMNGWDYLPQGAAALNANFFTADFYYNNNSVSIIPGRFGIGNAILVQNTNHLEAIGTRLTNGMVCGCAWNQDLTRANSGGQWGFYDGVTGVNPIVVNLDGFGTVYITVIGTDQTKTYRSASGRMTYTTWVYLQIKWIGTSFEVRLDGDILFQDANGPMYHPIDGVYALGINGSGSSRDDMYIVDPSDDILPNDYLGNIVVRHQFAVGNGDVIDLLPVGVAQNWQASFNTALDNTKYNETTTVGNYDLYAMNPNASSRQIFGIQVKGAYTQDNGVQLWGKNRIKTHGVEYDGHEVGLPSLTYNTITDYWGKNPNTNDWWTDAELNALQIGPVLSRSD